jgi:hypothetical protein
MASCMASPSPRCASLLDGNIVQLSDNNALLTGLFKLQNRERNTIAMNIHSEGLLFYLQNKRHDPVLITI